MARTITQYEASDIDLKENHLHKTLFGALIGAALYLIQKPAEGGLSKDLATLQAIAFFLTMTEQEGYVITKREDIPDVFKGMGV